jgi:hypothetical protein
MEEQERFYVERDGMSWCIRDREICYMRGPTVGQHRRILWFTTQRRALEQLRVLNRTRGHACDEPRCIECGAQPAVPREEYREPRCSACWFKYESGR